MTASVLGVLLLTGSTLARASSLRSYVLEPELLGPLTGSDGSLGARRPKTSLSMSMSPAEAAASSAVVPPRAHKPRNSTRGAASKSARRAAGGQRRRRSRWRVSPANLTLCRLVPQTCDASLYYQFQGRVEAAAAMHAKPGFVGGWSWALLVCAAASLVLGACRSASLHVEGESAQKQGRFESHCDYEGAACGGTGDGSGGDGGGDGDINEDGDDEALSALHPRANAPARRVTWLGWLAEASEAVPLSLPLASLKLFVLLLLLLELHVLTLPESSVLALPEQISRSRGALPVIPASKPLVPRWLVPTLMPGFGPVSAAAWAWQLENVRAGLLGSWCLFLLLPAGASSAFSYAAAALAYTYLASISCLYNLAHSTQGPMLFILGAALGVRELELADGRAGAWLRHLALVGVAVPVMLSSGLSKVRYAGVWTQFSGEWMRRELAPTPRSIYPTLNGWLLRTSAFGLPLTALMSWGNLAAELLLPLCVLLTSASRGRLAAACRALFLVSAASFHLAIFALIGPNFSRHLLLLLFIANPLGAVPFHESIGFRGQLTVFQSCASSSPLSPAAAAGGRLSGLRVAMGFCLLAAWLGVQLWSDAAHLLGFVPWAQLYNAHWPLPEYSMFARPTQPCYTCSAAIALGAAVAYGCALRWQLRHIRNK